MPQSLKNIFRLGKISHPNEKASQFSGKVTNINIVKEENNKLHDIANRICEQNVSLDLSWDAMRWEQIGGRNNSNIRNIDIDITEICTKANEEPVTLPLFWSFDTALHLCNKLGNGKITGFLHPENISDVDFLSRYGRNYKSCVYFWTPYSDEKEEGNFCEVYSGKEISKFDWGNHQPNGERTENIIALQSESNKFFDVNNEKSICLSCTVPHKVVYMRGLCEHSHLGILHTKSIRRKFYR